MFLLISNKKIIKFFFIHPWSAPMASRLGTCSQRFAPKHIIIRYGYPSKMTAKNNLCWDDVFGDDGLVKQITTTTTKPTFLNHLNFQGVWCPDRNLSSQFALFWWNFIFYFLVLMPIILIFLVNWVICKRTMIVKVFTNLRF